MTDDENIQALRVIDKYNRLGADGVKALLTTGRKDESGSFIPGLGWPEAKADLLTYFVGIKGSTNEETISRINRFFWILSLSEEDIGTLNNMLTRIISRPPPYKNSYRGVPRTPLERAQARALAVSRKEQQKLRDINYLLESEYRYLRSLMLSVNDSMGKTLNKANETINAISKVDYKLNKMLR